MDKRLLLFSGYNPRAVLAFLRTISTYDTISVSIIARDENDEILDTPYRKYVDYVRKKIPLDEESISYIYKILKERYSFDRLIIVPSTEYINRFCLDNRQWLENIGIYIPLVEKNIYEMISDKKTFGKVCQKRGLQVPEEFNFPKVFTKKFVAKPKKYRGDNGEIYTPVIILNVTDYEEFCKKYSIDDFFYQEYVEGISLYLLYYFSKDGEVWSLSQENLMQQPNGKSILWASSSLFHQEEISNQYIELLKGLHFYGLIMIELRKNNDKYYMIEANPRLWGPSQLFVDANYNLFKPFLRDLGYEYVNIDDKIPISREYFWYDGYIKSENKEVYYSGADKRILKRLVELKNIDVYNRKDTAELWKKMK